MRASVVRGVVGQTSFAVFSSGLGGTANLVTRRRLDDEPDPGVRLPRHRKSCIRIKRGGTAASRQGSLRHAISGPPEPDVIGVSQSSQCQDSPLRKNLMQVLLGIDARLARMEFHRHVTQVGTRAVRSNRMRTHEESRSPSTRSMSKTFCSIRWIIRQLRRTDSSA